MLKRTLVLLGETEASRSARKYAFRLARRSGIEIAGLAGVDLAFIEAPKAVPVGGMGFKIHCEEALTEQAEDARRRLRGLFEQECRDQGIPFEWLSFDGDPIEILQLAAETRDLLVTGHDTTFRGGVHEYLADTVAHLLTTAPRPIVVCSDEWSEGEAIMIAYDGSLPAMRTLQMFTLLGLADGKPVRVVAIDPSQERAARRAGAAVEFLRSHGCAAAAHPIASRVHPSEIFTIEAAGHGIGTLVMGAYGRRGLRAFLFGSTTAALAETPPCALFLYH